ncbi:hypothetical protein KAU19_01535, partial [Candidatus Parcubacteria bacterium]|nr:hypothetical protein [Candidatus Parcubacteria bacterium]
LSVCVVSGFLVCVNNVEQALSYSFWEDTGLKATAEQTGHVGLLKETSQSGIAIVIGRAIEVILLFLGVVFLILMIYSGYIWMIAKGNEQEIEKAKNTIKNASIGLIVVLAAYAISRFALELI